MKLFKLSTIIFLLVLFTTGCTSYTESPEELIEMPIYDETKKEVYKNIEKLLLNSNLLLPSNSKEVGKINEVDLNNDGINEIVAFEKKKTISEEDTNEVGFLVLQQELNDKNEIVYKNKAGILLSGDEIDYANFYDLDDDGIKEIVLSIKNGDTTNMHVFKFDENEIKNLYTLEPTWLPNAENISNIKVKLGYIDEGPELDILMIHLDSKTNTSYVSIANFNNNNLVIRDYVTIENVRDLDNLYINLGNIAKAKRGVILDIPTAKENKYITQILYIENGNIHKAFKDDDKSIMKAYYIPIEDINNDKVIDIPIVNGNGQVYTSKSSANVTWYNWNGKTDEQSGLVFTIQIYYNYNYNFEMLIPNSLVNKVTVQRESSTENTSYNFNYIDNKTLEQKTLFTISVAVKTIAEDSKNMVAKPGIILAETDEHNFVLHIKDVEELKKFDITTEALVEYFSFIY